MEDLGNSKAYLKRGALFGLALVVLALVLVSSCQRSLIFPGAEIVPDILEPPPGVEGLWFETTGGKVEGWLLPAQPPRRAPGPAVIFTHGNYEIIDNYLGAFEALRRAGVAVLLVEYPGYGRSQGAPTQLSIEEVMVAAYDALAGRPEVRADQIVAYGRSLGGGAACVLASKRPVRALILESTFSSMTEMIAQYWVPAFLVRDPFENAAVVARFEGPVLVFHGRADQVVPYEHALKISAASPNTELVTMACGHNNCVRDWRSILAFLREAQILPSR